jgi:hypothetical protein
VSRIHAGSNGWQTECWTQAKAGKIFVVEGYDDEYSRFFESLKADCGYDAECLKPYVICRPHPARTTKPDKRA